MKRNPIGLLSLMIALMLISFVYSYDVLNTVSVTGSASLNVDPDVATISVSITADGATASEATDKVEAIIGKVVDALQKNGQSKDDIATSSISVYPKYDYSSGTGVQVGYQVYIYLNVRITGITNKNNKVATVIDVIAVAGVTSISGITWSQSDEQKGKKKARQQAFEEAEDAANQYAKLAGRKLGKILKIDETNGVATPYFSNPSYQGIGATSSSSIPIGDVTVVITVIVVWSLI